MILGWILVHSLRSRSGIPKKKKKYRIEIDDLHTTEI